MAKLEAERDRVVTSFEKGFRTAEDAEQRVREIDAQLGAFQAGAERVQATLETDREGVAALVAEALTEWRFLSPAQQREILKPLSDESR